MAKAEAYRAVKRRDGRYMVHVRGGGTINGDEKTKFLMEKGLIKAPPPKKEAPAGQAGAEGEEGQSPAE